MGRVNDIIIGGLQELDRALEEEDMSYYAGAYEMFKLLVPGFEVVFADGYHQIK